MNKSHLLNPDLGLQQLRPSSGRPFFESPTPLDPALFLFFLFFAIMRKLQQTKDRARQAPGAQVTALGRALHSGFDLRHSAEASPKCQGGKMNREGGWSHAHSPGSPAVAPTGHPRLCSAPSLPGAGGCELALSAPMDQTAAVISLLEQSCAAPDQQQKTEVLFMSCVLFYFEQVP